MSSIPHTIRLQNGQLCNLDKRIAKQSVTLLDCLRAIPDPRRKQGRRYELALILFIVFVALLRGSRTLKDARLSGPFTVSRTWPSTLTCTMVSRIRRH